MFGISSGRPLASRLRFWALKTMGPVGYAVRTSGFWCDGEEER